MALTPTIIVLIGFIAMTILIAGVYILERGVTRLSEGMNKQSSAPQNDL